MRLHDAAFIRLDREREARIKHLESEIARLLDAGDRLESQMIEACRERDRLRLTDAEREAIATAARIAGAVGESDIKATLKAFLKRLDAADRNNGTTAASRDMSEQVWIPASERLPQQYELVMVGWAGRRDIGKGYVLGGKWHDPLVGKPDVNQPTHWMTMPDAPRPPVPNDATTAGR